MEEEEPTPQEVLSAVVARAMEAKYELCVENKGMTDAPPLLLGELANGDGFLMPDLLEGHPSDNLPLMLSALAEGITTNFHSARWKWLAYVVEGYAKPADEGATMEEVAEGWHRGQYEEEYKTNPATNVREGIIVSLFPWEGSPIGATVFYTYNDNGLPEYEKPEMTTGEGDRMGGNIADIFLSFTKACHLHESAQNN